MKAWHFVNDKLRDGRPVPEDGEKLVHDGELTMCVSGLHADAKELLRDFARKCALDVINLWDAPKIVREYLETGNEKLRDAARAADLEQAARDAQNKRLESMVRKAHEIR